MDTTDRIYTFIRAYFEAHGYPPMQQDISDACRVALTTVLHHLETLEERGMITRTPNVNRGIRLTDTSVNVPIVHTLPTITPPQLTSIPAIEGLPKGCWMPRDNWKTKRIDHAKA